MKICRYILVFLSLALLFLFISCRHIVRVPFSYFKMPYNFLYAGGKTGIKQIPEKIPVLQDGMLMLFALHQDGSVFMKDAKKITIKMGQPLGMYQFPNKLILSTPYSVLTKSISYNTKKVAGDSKFKTLQSSVKIKKIATFKNDYATISKSAISPSLVKNEEHIQSLSRNLSQAKKISGNLIRKARISNKTIDSRNLQQDQNITTTPAFATIDAQSLQNNKNLFVNKASYTGMNTATGQGKLFTYFDIVNMYGEYGKEFITSLLQQLDQQALKDFLNLINKKFKDSDDLKVFLDSLNICGFFDSDDTWSKSTNYTPDLEELRDFEDLISKYPVKLHKLLNRPFSKKFRINSQKDKNNTALEVTLKFFPKKPFHGHLVGMIIEVKNISESIAYDSVIALNVPKHLNFLTFWKHDVKSMGFSHYFIYKKEQILIKLYQPLKQKQIFRDIIVFKADPWVCKSNL